MFTNVQIFDTPGTYTWNKPKRSDGSNFGIDAFIIVEVCSGGGGGSSGSLVVVDDIEDKTGAIGGGGGGASSVVTRFYNFAEINDSIQVIVGPGGAGGIFPGVGTESTPGTSGTSGGISGFGPINNQGIIVKAKPGEGSITEGPFPFFGSSGGSLDGGSAAYFNGDRISNGELTWFGTYGGSAGAGYTILGDSFSLVSQGTSLGGGNGGPLGQNGTPATVLGCGGGGGGALLIETGEVGSPGNGANGKNGYVKIMASYSSLW